MVDDGVCGGIIKQLTQIYHSGMPRKTTQASLLMLLNTILMGVVVVVGAYTPRYRRHPMIGGLFLASATLVLPIVSIITTTVDGVHDLITYALGNHVDCDDDGGLGHLLLVFLWTGVVVVIGINASAVVAGDAREGRNIEPPKILLVKVVWTAYLTFSAEGIYFMVTPLYVIMFAKLGFKYATLYMARRSFALGRNPRLVAGYMAQLQQQQLHDDHTDTDTRTAPPPPALIVMGEDKVQLEQQPHGYNLKQMPNDQQGDRTTRAAKRLVTLDRVWGFQYGDDEAQRPPKDLCFSFALFKLLRCRFAKYTVSEAGFIKTSKFFRKTLLQDEDHYGRVFGIITDELSFINDYYHSSLPIHYSHPLLLLPALGLLLSLCSIGNSSFVVVLIVKAVFQYGEGKYGQISCFWATKDCIGVDGYPASIEIGSLYYDVVPLCLVVAVLLLAEARDIVSYICSNWTKVALIYHHVNGVWWQRSRVVQKCIFALVKYQRCKLVNNWEDKMKQCSILVLRPTNTPLRRLRHLLRFVGGHKKVNVPDAVKAAIFRAIKGENFTTDREHWLIPPPSSPIPAVYHAYNNRAAYSILVWNIATSVFEASQLPQPPSESDDHKTVATHLSRYCAYLVTSRPELLPDDAEWCRNLYGQVKKDADRVLGSLAKVQGGLDLYDQLNQVLSADSNHEVLRDGARLGQELVKDSAMGWEKLACFWVKMILYVAPSENLEAHAEAISDGGELITLLWAMLAHAGITGRRLEDDGGVTAAEEGRGFAN